MLKSIGLSTLPALIAVLMVASVAAMPNAPARPNPPTAAATSNAGELQVTWNAASGARFYTVGWINRDDFNTMQATGRDWLDAFHYATIPARYTTHTVSGLRASGDYYTIVGARTSRFGGEQPVWSSWSAQVTTSGQHGAGFCPITGLPIPSGGYLNVGNYIRWNNAQFTLTSASVVPSRTVAGEEFVAVAGGKLLKLCARFTNNTGGNWWLIAGEDNNLSTDTGIGFYASGDGDWLDVGIIPNGQTRSACDVWLIPSTATTAVYAVHGGDVGAPHLYLINVGN